LRTYPNLRLAAQVLGYVGFAPAGTNNPDESVTVGVEGIERTFNSKLTGAQGWLVTETDSRRRELVAFREQNVEARDGLNLVLTIDSVLQHALEAALAEGMEKHAPISATGIIVRPATGEILAMASLPDFDPNNLAASTAEGRRNRNITDIVEPGSTFKIVVVSGGLDDKVVTLRDVFDCERGHFAFAGRILHDHDPYGPLTVESIITKSSNIGSAKIGIKLGQNRLLEHIRNFGFGARTGIPLMGEQPGIVHPVKNWSKVTIAQIPMGHGIAVTRLQMAMAMAAIANNGWLMRPMLVKRLEDRAGHVVAEYGPQRVRQVVSERAAHEMVKALKTVVSADGTGPKAELEHYTVAGKTGTAQKVEGGRYVNDKFISSFIGFFPADKPELCISIVLDAPDRRKGYYGGQTAAPLFKSVAEAAANYLNIRPDREVLEPAFNESLAAATSTETVRRVAARNLTPE
jgi:cell division protein FtsI/penicillin-binding protein 2